MILKNLKIFKKTKRLSKQNLKTISYDTIGQYISSVSEKLDAQTSPNEQTLGRLFELENFSKGVNFLVEQNFDKAENFLKESLEDVFIEQIDSPQVLNTVFNRISFAQISNKKKKELEETLKEIFIINLSDPNCDSETLFKAIFNLVVFYLKNDFEKGVNFEDFYKKNQDQASLPLNYYNEIEMLFAILSHLKGDFESALEKYENLIEETEGVMSRGIILNNYAVCLMSHGIEKGENFDEKIINSFEDSILELESMFDY